MKWRYMLPLLVLALIVVASVYGDEKSEGIDIVEEVITLGTDKDDKLNKNTYVYYENLAETESVFYNTMEPLKELEALEYKLLIEMFEMKETEAAELKRKKEQAISFAEERVNKVQLSKENMLKIYKDLEKIKVYSEQLKNDETREALGALYEVTKLRGETIRELAAMYEKAATEDIETYELAGSFDSETSDIQASLLTVQSNYETIKKVQEKLNLETKEFSELKKKYYELIGEKRKK